MCGDTTDGRTWPHVAYTAIVGVTRCVPSAPSVVPMRVCGARAGMVDGCADHDGEVGMCRWVWPVVGMSGGLVPSRVSVWF